MPKEDCYGAKEPIKIWYANVDNIVTSKLIEKKTNSKYLMGYLDEVKPLVFILPKMGGYVKNFKLKDGGTDWRLSKY